MPLDHTYLYKDTLGAKYAVSDHLDLTSTQLWLFVYFSEHIMAGFLFQCIV